MDSAALAPLGQWIRGFKLQRMPAQSSPRMRGLDLPQEMVDHIVDFLHDDPQALISCSSVSRQWQSAARYHRFSSVRLSRDTRSMEKFLGIIKLASFQPFLACIRSLVVSSINCDGATFVSAQTLSGILSGLPCLGELHLTYRQPLQHGELMQPTYRFKINRLTIYHIGHCSSHTLTHKLQVLGLFSDIHTLWIIYPMCASPSAPLSSIPSLSSPVPAQLRISRFDISDATGNTSFWFEVLASTAAAKTLTELHVWEGLREDSSLLARVLSDAGRNLRSLSLNLSGLTRTIAGSSTLPQTLGLPGCSSLETLKVIPPPQWAWTNLCHAISSLTCQRTLHTLSLDYKLLPYEAAKASEWALMRSALAKFPALRTIIFSGWSLVVGLQGYQSAFSQATASVQQHLLGLHEDLVVSFSAASNRGRGEN